ncbi:HAD domain-containing protein [Actinophytocola sp.]|uniref:HAD domain-containing protein n=1 Tax=Actinophytocola sp. TaxID=1872138 RepID=UPI002ED0ED88
MTRGLLLLDVDGPLNPYAANRYRRPPGYLTYRRTATGWHSGRDARRYKGLRVWLNPSHGAQLLALAAMTSLELVWATTWQHEANERIAPAVGLPALPVIEFPGYTLTTGWDDAWKWPAVAAYAKDRPLAWLDDEHERSGAAEFARQRAGTPTLLCHVDPRQGLGSAHLAQVRRWAGSLA